MQVITGYWLATFGFYGSLKKLSAGYLYPNSENPPFHTPLPSGGEPMKKDKKKAKPAQEEMEDMEDM